jgi:hypothetical protein
VAWGGKNLPFAKKNPFCREIFSIKTIIERSG